MKVMWVTNIVIGSIHKKLYGKESNGFWMDALLKDFISNEEHELVIVTTGRNQKTIYMENNKVKYYILPGGYPVEYNHLKKKSKDDWKQLISKEKPDIINIWGSEFKQGLAAIKVDPTIPSVVFIQGILDTIARYYTAGMTQKELKKSITFRDVLKKDSILAQEQRYIKKAKSEKEMFELSGNIISENLWTDAHCKAIAPSITSHYCPLSINETFKDYRWSSNTMEPHTLMCNASGYPLKGLHMLLKALHLVKRRYPNVRLIVPGDSMISERNLNSRLRKTSYMKYIEKQVEQLDLMNNIEFTGKITPEEMAQRMSKANVFVLSSSIENHASTLKEAMMVGTPCVASLVGGVPEYTTHGKNALLYRFEEYELLAEYIGQIFEDRELANKLSYNALEVVNNLHDSSDIYNKTTDIYAKVINEKKLSPV